MLLRKSSPWIRRRGFSLAELMIVVAIIGILAAIATPKFNTAVLKARRSEATTVLAGVGLAEQAYFGQSDAWLAGASNPGTSLGKNLRAWNRSMTGWSQLGYAPDGLIRCNYVATLLGNDSYVRADALCDVDDDNGTAYTERYYVPSTSAMETTHGFTVVDASRY